MTEIGKCRIAIYNLLKEKPLFDYCENDEINVLILGTGWIGNEAIKCIFANGQIPGVKLNITVASQNAIEYLNLAKKSMPGLCRFARINKEDALDENYAEIDFKEVSIDKIKESGFSNETLKTIYDNPRSINYVVIALGDDQLNELLAHDLAKLVSSNKLIVNYFSESDEEIEKDEKVNRFSTLNDFENTELFKLANLINYMYSSTSRDVNFVEITKLFENKYKNEFVNQDFEENPYETFIGNKKAYDVDSSIASALHIFTKLYYLKIQTGCKNSMDELCRRIKKRDDLYYQLVALEHKRWNAFMTIRGYRYPTNEEKEDLIKDNKPVYKDIKDNKPVYKDNSKRLHVCLCSSKNGMSAFKKNADNWYNPNFGTMSELDKESRDYYAANKEYLRNYKTDIKVEFEKLLNSLPTSKEKDLFKISVDKLLEDNENAYNLYENSYINLLHVTRVESILKKLSDFNGLISPVVDANKKIDFFAYDEQIINMIPMCFQINEGRKNVVSFVDGPIILEAYLPLALLAKSVTFYQLNKDVDINKQESDLSSFYSNHGSNIYVSVKKVDNYIDAVRSKLNNQLVIQLPPATKLAANLLIEFKDKCPLVLFDIGKNEINDYSNILHLAPFTNLKIKIDDLIFLYNGQKSIESIRKLLPDTDKIIKSGFIDYYLKNKERWNGDFGIRKTIIDSSRQGYYCGQDLNIIKLIEILERLEIVLIKGEDKDEFSIIDKNAFDLIMGNEGSALELVTYYQTLRTGIFSDAQTGLRFSWGLEYKNSVLNEFDVVAMPLITSRPVMISNKDVNEAKMSQLYEIKSHAAQFDAIPILLAGKRSSVGPALISRSKLSKVAILFADDLRDINVYKQKLEEIIKNYQD